MNPVTKYTAGPDQSHFRNGYVAAVNTKIPMEDTKASGNSMERHQITISGKPGVTVKSSKPTPNPYGDSSNIAALKSGCATDSRGLDEALSSQNNCCQDPCDSFTLSPQAMLFNVMQDMMMLRSGLACGQSMNMMNGGMMPSPPSAFEQMASMMSGGPCINPGFGFDSPMQAMMNPGFGLTPSMNASFSFSSFSSFWGGGQF